MTAKQARVLRLGILFAAIVALVIVGTSSGVRSHFTVEGLRAQIVAWGAWGVLGYCLVFSIGLFLYMPGMVFLVVAILAWGQVAGAVIAFVASILAMMLTFAVVRVVGGQAFAAVQRPWLRRMLARLEAHPISVVALLRLVFITSPPVNYALALSPVRAREHLIGSALGMVLPIILVGVFTESVMRFFAM